MNYRSLADLSTTIRHNLHYIPHDVDAVVGIPRSGLLVASILGLYLNLPVADLDSFVAGRIAGVGRTRARDANAETPQDCLKVLVVDDSINSGKTLNAIKERLGESLHLRHIQFVFLCVYASERAKNSDARYLEICPKPRYFEWNIMQSAVVERSCVDIDGVLCRDPTKQENDDGPNYREFIRTAEPLFLPSRRIAILVTSRLEKYRADTEQWLSDHGVAYGKLAMSPYDSKEERVRANRHAEDKAETYANTDCDLFIESSYKQAARIYEITNRPVFCVETFSMLNHTAGLTENQKDSGRSTNSRPRLIPRTITLKGLFRRLIAKGQNQ